MGSKQSVVKGTHSDGNSKYIHKIFEEQFNGNWINRPALYYHDAVDGVRVTTFDDLNKKANRIATHILQMFRDTNANRNLDDDYIIAVCMATNDNVIATLLAIWKVGASYLSIEPTLPLNRTQHILNETRPALVICDHDVDRSVFENFNCISYDELLAKSTGCSEANIHTQNSVCCGDDGIAIILYTSGSSGVPRGVRIPHSAVWNKLRWLQLTFPYSASESVGVLISALSNVDSVAEIWNPLLNGVAVLVVPREITKDPSELVDLLETYMVQRIVVVPTLLTSILTSLSLRNDRLLSNLKTWICGGETLTTSLADSFFNYFLDGTHRLCNFYGSTEVMGDVSYFVCENIKELQGLSTVPIGYPIDNTVIFILNDDLNPVKPGEVGEIFVAGLNLARGYVAGRGKYKFIYTRFSDNPKFARLFRTGDYGKLIKSDCIQYEGRRDSQIKIRGNRVELLEIEKNLQSVDGVDSGVVLCYNAGKGDQTVLAFVVLKSNFDGLPSQRGMEIEKVLRTKVRDFEMPHVVPIKSMPLLANGKIDRQTLLNIYENGAGESDMDYDLTGVPDDRLAIAKDVFEIISNVIGPSRRSTISPQSSFYELGGNSLNSIVTVTQLRDKGHFIGVTDFITAKSLTNVIDKICEGGSVEENLTRFQTIPLSHHHKHHVISIITTTFHEKSDLGKYLIESCNQNDHRDFVEQTWDYLLEKDLSFAVTDCDGTLVGISINKDGQDLPKTKIVNSLGVILEFMESIEKPVREKMLPAGKNKVFHSFLMATSAKLTPQENIEAIQKMEEVNLDIARRKGFVGIFTSNTNPLTQQLGSGIYNYETLVDYQINKYVHRDGSKPFRKAPNTQRVLVQWKSISE